MSTSNKRLVRVFTLDGNKHGFMVDENTTTAQLCNMVANKMQLKNEPHFALYEVKGEEERCLASDEKPACLADKWSSQTPLKMSNDSSVNGSFTEPKIIFKKKIFLRDEDDQDNKDLDPQTYDTVRHCLYIQAVYNVIEGEYPCSMEEATKLAALQTQRTHCDHNPTVHVAGYFGANLASFVPKPLFANKSPAQWESAIFNHHASLKGISMEEAESLYLNIVKSWPFYGTHFFKNCKVLSKNRALSGKVMIGVNVDGIVLASSKEKKDQIGVFPFTDLLSWHSSSNGATSTFTFEVGTYCNDSTKYTFETRFAASISDLIQTYVDALIQMIKLDIVNETSSPRE